MNFIKEAVSPDLLELLHQLMKQEFLNSFDLVGGTALALQLGHRKSIDIDLFGIGKYDLERIQFNAVEKLGATLISANEIMIALMMNEIKIDLVNYPYQRLKPLVLFEGIRMYDLEDIVAMKLSAITRRGSKKDFWDIYFLLEKFSIMEMIELYKQKFKVSQIPHVLRSLGYFGDADREKDPEKIIPATWEEIKKKITDGVSKIMF